MKTEERRATVSLSPLKRVSACLATAVRNRQVLILLGIIALAAYLRLWNIHHLFNAIHDYDEGVYSLGAHFISQGYMPYQDFMLTHPPLYNLVLASVYKIFGYDFFYGKYLSVTLSLACIVLIYLVGKKMYRPTTGLAAAAFFAVSPMMVYFGRRCVQESMGVLFIVAAAYFAFDFINNSKSNRLFFSGLFLGLAIATKYIFIPAAAAIIIAVILLSMGERFWQSIKVLGRPLLWVSYICIAAIFLAILMPLQWSLNLDIAIPFFDTMYPTPGNVAVVIFVFVLPLVIALAMLGERFSFKEWWSGIWEMRHNRGLWLLLAGTALAFVAVTGYFWLKTPQEFVYQTFLLQQNRPYIEFPSLVAMIRTAPASPYFLRMAFLPVLLAIPLILVILNRREFSRGDCFLSVAMIVSLVLCQGFYHLPRYYISLLPFFLLGISSLMPAVNAKLLAPRLQSLSLRIKASLLAVGASFLLFLSLSIVLLTNYTGYDVNWPWFASNEEYVYNETVNYLETAGAEKVYAVNPIFVALAPDLESTLAIDSFALLWLEETPSEQIIQDRIAEGVDYVVLDSWVKYWASPYDKQARELTQAVRRNARLVKVISPDTLCSTEIYLLGAEAEGIFNGDFDHWVTDRGIKGPLGWSPVLIEGEGDLANIRQAYKDNRKCVKLAVYEDGEKDGELEATHAGIAQTMPFPEDKITVEVLPEVNTKALGRAALGPTINFLDEVGHSLAMGFSDEIDAETVFQSAKGDWLLVVKPAELGRWSEHSIDLPAYWSQAGWQQPKEIHMLIVISAHYDNPGRYAFYVARIGTEDE